MQKRTLAIDFDGVIHRYSKGWQDGSCYDRPMPHAFDVMAKLLQDYCVYIHTCRDPQQVLDWHLEHAAPFKVEVIPDTFTFWDIDNSVGVTQRKLPAVVYVDDRGLRFSTWNQTLCQIERLAMYNFEV